MSEGISVETIRRRCEGALSPLIGVDGRSYFYGERTDAGRKLPRSYLVYFLLHELLKFPVLGKQEKVAWSIVVDFKGKIFVLEHRKLGFGLFAQEKGDPDGQAVVELINAGVQEALPFYKMEAQRALNSSEINLLSRSRSLYERFLYFAEIYDGHRSEADALHSRFAEGKCVAGKSFSEPTLSSVYDRREKTVWVGTSVIEAFFSWTEHFFIHLALLRGTIQSASEVVALADGNWQDKFKLALNFENPAEKRFYDKLILVRREVRNFVAHGAFGKKGQAFDFHSPVGAIPVFIERDAGTSTVSLTGRLTYENDTAVACVREFAQFLKTGPYAEAFKYAHDSQLPTILTYVRDGTYAAAIRSPEQMDDLINTLQLKQDYHADMAW